MKQEQTSEQVTSVWESSPFSADQFILVDKGCRYTGSCVHQYGSSIPGPVQMLVDALERYRGQMANDGKSGYAEEALAAYRATPPIGLVCVNCDRPIENGQSWKWLPSGTRAIHNSCK